MSVAPLWMLCQSPSHSLPASPSLSAATVAAALTRHPQLPPDPLPSDNALIRSEAKTRFMSKHDEDLYWLDRRERERRGLVYQYSQGHLQHSNPSMVASSGPVFRAHEAQADQ